MKETLERHDGGGRCAGRRINDIRFTDDIDMLEQDEETDSWMEHQRDLVWRLVRRRAR